MANKLGQFIGKVQHTFSTKNHAGDKVQTVVTFDFSTASDNDIKQWLVSDRTIAIQRPMRTLSADEITANYNGQVVLASDVGKKIKSRAERIAELVNSGMPENLATVMVDDPAKFAEMIEKLSK